MWFYIHYFDIISKEISGEMVSMIKKKLFWKNENERKKVYFISWNEDEYDYYSFIKKQLDNGYHQIVVDSAMMLDFISFYAAEVGWDLYRIEMMEDDGDLDDELSTIIKKLKSNRGNYALLIEKMREVVEDECIEIRRIYWDYEHSGEYIKIFLQVNGIMGISEDDSDTTKIITSYVEEKLNT